MRAERVSTGRKAVCQDGELIPELEDSFIV